ncbi:MAG: hypothetical protein K9J81_10535 [Desulfohalobiaceae bacterium]|nr:hypothetical protein [Desulfohalobiaceae bacterium]
MTGFDPQDSSFYDLIFNASVTSVDKIVENIVQYVQKPGFQTTPESQRKVEDLLLAARVKSILVKDFPKAEVSAQSGSAYVKIKSTLPQEDEVFSEVKNCAFYLPSMKTFLGRVREEIYFGPTSGMKVLRKGREVLSCLYTCIWLRFQKRVSDRLAGRRQRTFWVSPLSSRTQPWTP